ncbi:MCM DNA helicase complex subunit [Hamiltosporidium tvaerminnensis]|nr:MCM DNA helicase complex subunit [Hamiltosporidium tvaerminnensis]
MSDNISSFLSSFTSYITNLKIQPCPRLVLNLDAFRTFSKEFTSYLINNPLTLIPHVENILSSYNIKHIGTTGSLPSSILTPRTLSSQFLSKIVCVQGIVTHITPVQPKVVLSVHHTDTTNDIVFYEKEYRDSTMLSLLPPTSIYYPIKDHNNTPLVSDFGLSSYMDYQSIKIQEMPENAPPSQLPRNIICILSDDLVDTVKPGDRVLVYGVYRCMSQGSKEIPNYFTTVVLVNNIKLLSFGNKNCEKENEEFKENSIENLRNENKENSTNFNSIKENDIENTIETSNTNIFNSYSIVSPIPLQNIYNSIAPSIYGHSTIKKAVSLLLVGGNEIKMKNGSKIRGSLNLLLVGDPGTAKSQFLRYVNSVSPISVLTTGKGCSVAGLTCCIKMGEDTVIEAGAMVLSDMGVCCVDEFDKMSAGDRVGIHEVMEQQSVTVAKGGIYCILNARCSVIAAANPVLGYYSEKMSVGENVGMGNSIISRFDIVMVVKDTNERDREIAHHVLNNRSGKIQSKSNYNISNDCISQKELKKYFKAAKEIRPVMTKEAGDYISNYYVSTRQSKPDLTPRFLETLVRLATAHSKLRMCYRIEEEDSISVVEMMEEIMSEESKFKGSKKRKIETRKNLVNEEIILEEINERDDLEERKGDFGDKSNVEKPGDGLRDFKDIEKQRVFDFLHKMWLNDKSTFISVSDLKIRMGEPFIDDSKLMEILKIMEREDEIIVVQEGYIFFV